MDQIWLASPSPAMRLWPASRGATWRLNQAATTWARKMQWTEASWRVVAADLSDVHSTSATREGRLAGSALRWRSLAMSTGWLVWFMPDSAVATGAAATGDPDAAQALRLAEILVLRIDLRRRWAHVSDPGHLLSEPVDEGAGCSLAGLRALLHPQDRRVLVRAAFEALRGSSIVDVDARSGRRPAPDMRRQQVRLVAERDAQGRAIGLLGIAFDRADRASPGRGAQGPAAAGKGSAARSEFAARMSHELRTPLNAVLGFAQLMEHEGATVPIQVQLDRIAHIRQAGEQLLALVGDVLEHLKQEVLPGGGASAAAAVAQDTALATSRSLSVLYIEDNPVNVILVEELVGMRPDTTLRCAVDGLAGVAEAHASRPDVVLVDMQLPDIDGFEVLRRLRANPALDGSAIIALSANGMSEDIARARAAGFDDYWTKPIDFRHFLQGLDTLARARQMPVGGAVEARVGA